MKLIFSFPCEHSTRPHHVSSAQHQASGHVMASRKTTFNLSWRSVYSPTHTNLYQNRWRNLYFVSHYLKRNRQGSLNALNHSSTDHGTYRTTERNQTLPSVQQWQCRMGATITWNVRDWNKKEISLILSVTMGLISTGNLRKNRQINGVMWYFSFIQDFTFRGHDVELPIIHEMRWLLSPFCGKGKRNAWNKLCPL